MYTCTYPHILNIYVTVTTPIKVHHWFIYTLTITHFLSLYTIVNCAYQLSYFNMWVFTCLMSLISSKCESWVTSWPLSDLIMSFGFRPRDSAEPPTTTRSTVAGTEQSCPPTIWNPKPPLLVVM